MQYNKKLEKESNILTKSHYKEWSNFSFKWFYGPKRYNAIIETHLNKHKAKWTHNMLLLLRQDGIKGEWGKKNSVEDLNK